MDKALQYLSIARKGGMAELGKEPVGAIARAVNRAESPINPADFPYIAKAQSTLWAHMILLGVTTVLIVTLPVYKKALRKIKTSVEVEDNGKLEAIDISGE